MWSIWEKFVKSKQVNEITDWSKSIKIPLSDGISVYEFTIILYRELFLNSTFWMRANAIAYSFFLSLFPSFIIIFSILPYLPFNKIEILSELRFGIHEIMPNQTGDDLFDTLSKFLKTKRGDILSIGFILSIYFASNGLVTMMKGFEKTHKVFLQRNFIQQRLVAIQMTFLLGFLLAMSSVFVISGTWIFTKLFTLLRLTKLSTLFALLIKWVVVVGAQYLGIAILYKFGMSLKEKLPFFSFGALVATVFSILSSVAFSFYVDNFSSYNKIYGSFVAGIVLLLWLQMNAVTLIFGFELNAAIALAKDERVPLIQTEDVKLLGADASVEQQLEPYKHS